MYRPTLVRRSAVWLVLLVTLVVLTLGACGSSSGGEGGGEAAEKKPTPDSPIASEPGWLAYQYQTDPEDLFSIKVHLVRVDGSKDHEIATNLPGAIRHPDFSPDGSRLVFDQLTSEESSDQIYVAKADGSAAKRIPHCKLPRCFNHWEPAWSPDSSRLAVSTGEGPIIETGNWPGPTRFGIAIIDVNSEQVTQVVDNENAVGQNRFPRWSPDGKRLVFYRARAKSFGTIQTAVFVVDVDGSNLRRLTPWNMLAGDPDWSPKGDRIVFSTRPLREFPSGRSELYTMRPDGSGIKALTSNGANGPRATEPRWTPDGKAILYVRETQAGTQRSIWAIDHTGRKDGPVLTKEPNYYTHPVLQHGSQ
jgi:Tol biopolymer transport system component